MLYSMLQTIFKPIDNLLVAIGLIDQRQRELENFLFQWHTNPAQIDLNEVSRKLLLTSKKPSGSGHWLPLVYLLTHHSGKQQKALLFQIYKRFLKPKDIIDSNLGFGSATYANKLLTNLYRYNHHDILRDIITYLGTRRDNWRSNYGDTTFVENMLELFIARANQKNDTALLRALLSNVAKFLPLEYFQVPRMAYGGNSILVSLIYTLTMSRGNLAFENEMKDIIMLVLNESKGPMDKSFLKQIPQGLMTTLESQLEHCGYPEILRTLRAKVDNKAPLVFRPLAVRENKANGTSIRMSARIANSHASDENSIAHRTRSAHK